MDKQTELQKTFAEVMDMTHTEITDLVLELRQENESLRLQLSERDKEIARLRDALRDLLDEQNGPPLERHRETWQRAVDRGYALLSSDTKQGTPGERVLGGEWAKNKNN